MRAVHRLPVAVRSKRIEISDTTPGRRFSFEMYDGWPVFTKVACATGTQPSWRLHGVLHSNCASVIDSRSRIGYRRARGPGTSLPPASGTASHCSSYHPLMCSVGRFAYHVDDLNGAMRLPISHHASPHRTPM